MQALEELVDRWRNNPDGDATLALCAHLGRAPRADLLREVGETAEAWHKDDPRVMMSVGRMYLEGGLLVEAQAALVQASRTGGSDPAPYRLLGEVLLRRGDAIRGEKVFARALRLGSDDPTIKLWHERAIVYMALQTRQGLRAVADEVARTVPQNTSIPAPEIQPPRVQRRSRPPGPAKPTGPRRSSPPGARRGATQPREQAAPEHGLSVRHALPTQLSHETQPSMPSPGPIFPPRSDPPPAPASGPLPAWHTLPDVREALQSASDEAQLAAGSRPLDLPGSSLVHAPLDGSTDGSLYPRADNDPTDPSQLASHVSSAPRLGNLDDPSPSPETVLLHLSQVGLFEARSSVVPAWEAPPRAPARRLWVLASGVVLSAALGLGAFQYARGVQATRKAEAQQLARHIDKQLQSAAPGTLESLDDDFRRLFDLDSNGPDTAQLWLDSRVQRVLVGQREVTGIEAAIQRAHDLGVQEPELIFARLASAAASHDWASGGSLIERYQDKLQGNGRFHLVAGYLLEHAGNSKALSHYEEAVSHLPGYRLPAARLLHLQLMQGEAVASERVSFGDPSLDAVFRRLAWANHVLLGRQSSPEAGPASTPTEPMPEWLQPSARGVAALVSALADKEPVEPQLRQAIAAASSPAVAVWLGRVALRIDAPSAAHSASQRALELSAMYKPAHALAASVALAQGRLSAARKVATKLDPLSAVVTQVEAVQAYELGQAQRLVAIAASDELGDSLQSLKQATAAPRDKTSNSTLETLRQHAESGRVWARFVATDEALYRGLWDEALELLAPLPESPAHAIRRACALREKKDIAGALTALAPALSADEPLPRHAAEITWTLLAAERTTAAASSARSVQDQDEQLATWLEASVWLAQNPSRATKRRIARLALPGPDAGLTTRRAALRALTQADDPRSKALYRQLRIEHPHLVDVRPAGSGRY